MRASPGDLVAGRYRLERPLGEGGMGEVWAAVHTITEQARAVKLVSRDASDEGTKKRMLREARAASAVRHPNVVAVHDVVEGDDGAPVLVMDLLEGETLADRLERETRLAPSDVVAIGAGIAAGLDAAHALGIVHRDLKPANVFLGPEPKILDFGVAKLTATSGPARATNLLTESGAMIGTPCYMAPEQAFGDGEVDARTDVWALGVVLYECLSGVRPADGATVGQVFKVLATGAIVPLAERCPELPPGLVALVDRMLRIDSSERIGSAHEVREALEALGRPGAMTSGARPVADVLTTDATAVVVPRPRGAWAPWIAAGLALVAAGTLTIARLGAGRSAEPVASPVAEAPAKAVEAPAKAIEPPAAPAASAAPAAQIASAGASAAPPHAQVRRAAAPAKPAPAAKATAPSGVPASDTKLLTEPGF